MDIDESVNNLLDKPNYKNSNVIEVINIDGMIKTGKEERNETIERNINTVKKIEKENTKDETEQQTEVSLENIKKTEENMKAEINNLDNDTKKQEEGGKNKECVDEYHYVKSGEYTSEMFKVVVQNIPKKITYGQFREKITEILGFTPKKTKYNTSNCYAFLAFKDEEQRLVAIKLLNGYEWKSNKFLCKKAGPAKDPLVRENKRKAKDTQYKAKKCRMEELEGLIPEEKIVHAVCPYASKSYEEQLRGMDQSSSIPGAFIYLKEEDMKWCIKKLSDNMRNNQIGNSWINERSDKMCLNLMPIIKSPVETHYRNKVEFSIGTGPDDKDNTVGFRLGAYREGNLMIVEPTKCINCSKASIEVAKDFQTFIKKLQYPSFNVTFHIGLWQQLTVRTTLLGDLMAIVQINRSYFSEEEKYEECLKLLSDYLIAEGNATKITSAYISWSSKKNNNIDVYNCIFGKKCIEEQLLGLKFRISPTAFFQVNTKAAELLYRTVREWCERDKEDSCVLDICCGTGTIGLCIANGTSLPVIGVELCEESIEDAKYNAAANGVENTRFIAGRAEKVLHHEIRKLKSKKHIIAIVDPPRAGLHKDVLLLLRECNAITEIIYVSCSPKQASDNFLGLCRNKSKKYRGSPFRTVQAVPVDLFPQTPHCELIVRFQRVTSVSCI